MMTSLTGDLDPKVTNLARLIGLLTQDDRINQDWFAHADAELRNVPRRVRELLQLTANVLGPGTTPSDVPGGTWYSIPNPVDRARSTGFYLVAPPPPSSSTAPVNATVGLGVLQETGYGKLSIKAYGYVPLFKLSSNASPTFVIGTQSSSVGVVASLSDNETFKANDVSFTSMKLEVNFLFSSAVSPSMRLTFSNLKGAPAGVPSEYTSLQQLLDHIRDHKVGEWLAAVILQGTYWLDHYVAGSIYTIGDILTTACVLTADDDGNYHLNLDYLKNNVNNPKVLAENFLFNLLHKLSDSSKPIVPIPVGAEGGGIYIVREKADGSNYDYGARLLINDIKVGGGAKRGETTSGDDKSSPPPEISLQLGKWIAGEEDKNSWVARSLGQTANFSQPGVSVYLLRSDSTGGECKSAGPNVTFKPRVELVSLGLDVYGSAGQALFDVGGYTMAGAELRVFVKQSDSGLVFGAGASIDDLGIPLGPSFGSGAQGTGSNPVAQSLLESGSPAEEKDEKAAEGDKSPVNPTFSMSAAYVQGGSFAFQLYDSDGKPSDKVVLPVQRALGPLQCQRIGLGWVQKDKYLSLLFDGGIHLDVLSVDLQGLSVGIPVGSPGDFSKYSLDLEGMGMTLKAGQVEVSGAFVKLAADTKSTPPRTYPEYNGVVLIKAGTFSITAIGSYAYVKQDDNGYASLFIFGALEGKLGGPAFFYVTGLAAGFGYNRGLVLPDMDGVADFPLVAAAADPSKLGGLPPNPAKALKSLGSTVPAVRGNYWLAAGVRFTSFDLVNTTALLVVQFGQELEISLLGVSKITLPPPSASGGEPKVKYAYAELGMQVKLLPAKGFFSATAVLSKNSYVLDPACKLTGGFAFYVWFAPHENAGQFVLTLGGYHPDFSPPPHFPKVPRLGFNWPLPGDVTISGEAYFALTPSAVMAGAGLQVLYSAGNLRAWFKAQMDALISWAPFHYRLDISISLGASYRVNLLFVTTTLKVELGASLSIWGPPMGGRVHINWYIISFTVSFGADESQQPAPLKWSNNEGTGFAQTLLPHQAKSALKTHEALLAAPAASVVTSGVFSVTVNDGLVNAIQKDGKDIWIVRANHFVFSAVTAFPTTEVDVVGPATTARFKPKDACGADYTTVYIRPMNAEVTSSVFEVKMTDRRGATYDLAGVFDFKPSCQSVPAAKWGKPVPSGQDPEMNELLPKRLMGIEKITPRQPSLSPSGTLALNIDIARAFTYDTVDEHDESRHIDPDHLPLAPGQTPVGPVPAVKADALDEIKRSLTSTGVTDARAQLLSKLQGYGFDPVTNAPMTTLAANPGAVLVGKPLILAAA